MTQPICDKLGIGLKSVSFQSPQLSLSPSGLNWGLDPDLFQSPQLSLSLSSLGSFTSL